MNLGKRILCVLLSACLAMSVAGCGGDGKTDGPQQSPLQTQQAGDNKLAAKGRYVEEIVSKPEELKQNGDIFQTKEGFACYAFDNNSDTIILYTTKDGKDWEKQDTSWLDAFKEATGDIYRIMAMTQDTRERIYLVLQTEREGAVLLRVTAGTAEKITVPSWQEPYSPEDESFTSGTVGEDGETPKKQTVGQNIHISEIAVLENGDFVLSFFAGGTPTLYSGETGEVLREFPVDYGWNVAVREGKVLISSPGYQGNIHIFNVDTGEEEETLTLEMGSGSALLVDQQDQSIYSVGTEGVRRMVKGGGVWEELMDGSLFAIGLPSNELESCILDGNGGFYMLFATVDGDMRLTHCFYDPEAPISPDTELTIYSMDASYTVVQAMGEFQQSHPNVVINHRILQNETTPTTLNDLYRTINTELLAGLGPDLLVLDIMPVRSYMEKGALADLSDMIDPLIQEGALFENVVNSLSMDGKVYAVPTRYQVPMMTSEDQSVLDGIRSLADLAKDGGDKPLLKVDGAYDFLSELSTSTVPSWLNEQGGLNRDGIKTFFIDAKAVFDKYGPEDKRGNEYYMSYSVGGNGTSAVGMNESMMEWSIGNTRLCYQDSAGFNGLKGTAALALDNALTESDSLHVAALPGNAFLPMGILGVNAAGKNIDLSKDFVRFVLSEQIQNYNFNDGFPVNRTSFNKNFAYLKEPVRLGIGESVPPGYDQEEVIKLVESLNTPVLQDYTMMQTVLNAGEKYLTEQASLEEALQEIEDGLEMYLAE